MIDPLARRASRAALRASLRGVQNELPLCRLETVAASDTEMIVKVSSMRLLEDFYVRTTSVAMTKGEMRAYLAENASTVGAIVPRAECCAKCRKPSKYETGCDNPECECHK